MAASEIDALRSQLRDQPALRSRLDAIWDAAVRTPRPTWPTTQEINLQLGIPNVPALLKGLPRGTVVADNGVPSYYELTLLGLLLTKAGSQCEKLLIQYLTLLQGEAKRNHAVQEIDSSFVGKALSLDSDALMLLGQVIFSGALHGGKTDITAGRWAFSVPGDLPTIALASDLRAYLHARAVKQAIPRGYRPTPEGTTPGELGTDSSVRETETREEAVLTAAAADQPTDDDLLGFRPYVEAIAAFLTNEHTTPPLAMSIEGDWGSGKSSFMLQLERCLREEHHQRTVRFNAWRHDREDALWAAFALEFLHELKRQQPWVRRPWSTIRLAFGRYRWRDGWLDFLQALLVGILLVVVLGCASGLLLAHRDLLIGTRHDVPSGASRSVDVMTWMLAATVTVLGWVLGLRVWLQRLLSPLATDLRRHLRHPDYSARVGFVEEFHRDFGRMVSVYVPQGARVFVFIDDLDRCDPPRAADLMQGLNLMLSESAPVVFVIGMDREKVAAAVAVKHGRVLPYLAHDFTGSAQTEGRPGWEYGNAFVDKFIQLPFRIPTPGPAEVAHLLERLSFGRQGTDSQRGGLAAGLPDTHAGAGVVRQAPDSEPPESSGVRETVRISAAPDSPAVRDIVGRLAAYLDFNPRRVKQFLNLLRLRAFLADVTGGFRTRDSEEPPSLEALAKFLLVALRWPLIVRDLERWPNLLVNLQLLASHPERRDHLGGLGEEERARMDYWYRESGLPELLRLGTGRRGDPDSPEPWNLLGLNLPALLRVQPRTPHVEPTTQPTQTAEVRAAAMRMTVRPLAASTVPSSPRTKGNDSRPARSEESVAALRKELEDIQEALLGYDSLLKFHDRDEGGVTSPRLIDEHRTLRYRLRRTQEELEKLEGPSSQDVDGTPPRH